MKDKFCFTLWYGPQYCFAYGIAHKGYMHVTWLEKVGLCDGKYTDLPGMFHNVARYQGWNTTEGLAMTIISDEMYEDTMQIKTQQAKATTILLRKRDTDEITNRLETS